MPKPVYDAKGQPIYDKEDFPSYQEFQKASEADLKERMKTTPAATPRKNTGVLGMMGRASTAALPSIAGLAGEMTPAGPVGAALGGAGGSIIANKLRQASPDYFGEPSNNTGMSALTDGLLQGIFGGGLKTAGALVSKLVPGTAGFRAGLQDLISNLHEPNIEQALGKLGKTGDAIKSVFPQKMLPLTRNVRGQFNKATYGPNIPNIGVISSLARILSTMGSVPENPANIPPGN